MKKGGFMTLIGFVIILFVFVFFIFIMSCLSPNTILEGLCAPFNPFIQFLHLMAGG